MTPRTEDPRETSGKKERVWAAGTFVGREPFSSPGCGRSRHKASNGGDGSVLGEVGPGKLGQTTAALSSGLSSKVWVLGFHALAGRRPA